MYSVCSIRSECHFLLSLRVFSLNQRRVTTPLAPLGSVAGAFCVQGEGVAAPAALPEGVDAFARVLSRGRQLRSQQQQQQLQQEQQQNLDRRSRVSAAMWDPMAQAVLTLPMALDLMLVP